MTKRVSFTYEENMTFRLDDWSGVTQRERNPWDGQILTIKERHSRDTGGRDSKGLIIHTFTVTEHKLRAVYNLTSSGSWTAVALRWTTGLGCIVCAPHSLAESRRDLLGCLARRVCVAAQQALPAGVRLSHHSCTLTISAGAAEERPGTTQTNTQR